MERIVEDVLELARQGRTIDDPDALDLESAARQAWAGVDTRGLELVVVDEGRLRADEDRFRRLLENCYLNAATHADGATTIRVGLEEGTLFVEDDGPGFPDEDPGQVFESGYTTAETGTGFRLAIVKDIAEAHGWTVRATRGDEGGARLEFEME
jgi:signal transduction histidine kinase